jgi:hypothetical protein
MGTLNEKLNDKQNLNDGLGEAMSSLPKFPQLAGKQQIK